MPSIAVPALAAGQNPDSTQLTQVTTALTGLTTYTVKSATQNTSSTTLAAVTDLVLAVATNAVYEVFCYLIYSRGGTENIKINWTAPAGSTLEWSPNCVDTSITTYRGIIDRSTHVLADTPSMGGGSDPNPHQVALIRGMLQTGGSSGNLQLQYAAVNAFAGTNAWIYINSYLRTIRLS